MMLFLFYVLCIGFSCFRVCFQSLCFCCTLASVRGGVRERVCSSTCCVTSRACVNIRMYLFVFECDTNMTSIQFELRTSALRVLPLSTGLTAYRRYQIWAILDVRENSFCGLKPCDKNRAWKFWFLCFKNKNSGCLAQHHYLSVVSICSLHSTISLIGLIGIRIRQFIL
jgi:hypothetical protein